MIIKVKKNENLFAKFNNLASRLYEMNHIVREEHFINDYQLNNFHLHMCAIIKDIESLESEVGMFINDCNNQ